MDHVSVAQALIQFLNRVNLTGAEVDAFNVMRAWLAAIQNGQLVVTEKPKETNP